MTRVAVSTYTHSITFVTDNILKSLKDVIVLSGLDPTKLADQWDVLHRGIKTWMNSEHLECVVLEIYHPATDKLLFRWDIEIAYAWSGDSGSVWTDTDQLRFAIRKAGVAPSEAKYGVVVTTKPGRADVEGWSNCSLRSTDGFVRQSLGSTINHNGLGAGAAYWRKVG